MSEDNVEIVRRVIAIGEEGMRRGDPGAAFDVGVAEGVMAVNIEFDAGPRGGTGIRGIAEFVGREGYLGYVRTLKEEFDDIEGETERFIDIGDDRVLALGHVSATGKTSRAPVDMRPAYLCELEAACVVRMVMFHDWEVAFKALGVSE